MPTEVILPRVDMDMTEGMIAAWHVHEGEAVRAGAVIFEIETSKATMEVDAPASGTIRHISTAVGETVPVGTPIAWIYADGEAVADLAGAQAPAAALAQDADSGDDAGGAAHDAAPVAHAVSADTASAHVASAPSSAPAVPVDMRAVAGRLRATPAARRLARERGLDLHGIAGSGPLGRIGASDVPRERAAPLHGVWLREGTGDPLVLLHGFAAELNSWRPFCHAFERAAPAGPGVLALDLPAHGKSAAQRAGTLDDIVAAVDATLAAAHITHCHLAGHSFGGAISLATAACGSLAQTRIRSLTLIAPAGLGPDSNAAFLHGITQASRRASFAAWLKELFADPVQMDQMFVATAEQQLGDAHVRARLAALADTFFPDGAQSLDLRGVLAALSIPVRVIWGLQDRILPARHARGLPGRVAVHRFARVGHLPHIEARDDVAAIVAQNIASAS
ncbi:acetoin dehydrogenase dihydrolipoyllysine-residue acetyltransferase subunit [Paraburkholderia sp. SARCC-3016]|uniref:acetoin dehydrogenase dihydrolipoyllysine-residue acetyltransferase subunit n=1 Tax=Paraburkholderia sp. SARCC-3016 TaxID=3058611 RepID=UPI00280941BE|nr:acetoin dehydrogenase dihydrolipoyllysine-residue acetyltransferase subunit [Paraburkholderia sp. SARCC-3016]MDQ7981759.1 acetoin dehydrogenase dihydrolipoyllysine-residue acetyltransferase subunit [Paraburkholderia sp. SARCC-3016]